MAEPVRYVNEMPRLLDEEFLSDVLSGSASLNASDQMQKLIYTKASDWSYEKEWRICMGSGRTQAAHEDIPFDPREVGGIIFGCNMPSDDRREFADLVYSRYPHAMIYEAKKATRDFGLIITPI